MKWIWSFYLYSFLGFLLELCYARATGAKKQDRKCRFFLPICPVYGAGATAISLLPPTIAANPALLYLSSAALATGTEYLAALFYEKLWHVSFWDYSMLPGNIRGRVCIPFSLAWGFLGIALVYWIHPILSALTARIPDLLLLPVTLVFAVDFVLTGHVLRSNGSTESLRWYRE